MGLTIKQVVFDCRSYTNSIQGTMLTPEGLINAINDARLEWADRIRWPELKATLNTVIGATSLNVSSLNILDIVAVYYGSVSEANRVYPCDRDYLDLVRQNTSVSVVTLSGTSLPTRYFWNMADQTFEFVTGSGDYTISTITPVIIRYHGEPTLYTTATDDSTVLEIPTRYCFKIKHPVASFLYNRTDDDMASAREADKWEKALIKAEALFNKSKRDFPKVVKDGMAYSRQQYVDNY